LLKKIKSHPFIIKYIDSFSDDQRFPYIITELAELGSLEQEMQARYVENKLFNQEEILSIIY